MVTKITDLAYCIIYIARRYLTWEMSTVKIPGVIQKLQIGKIKKMIDRKVAAVPTVFPHVLLFVTRPVIRAISRTVVLLEAIFAVPFIEVRIQHKKMLSA